MSDLPFLTDAEVLEIVKPMMQKAAIVRWFLDNGFRNLRVKPNGMPLISKTYFDQVFCHPPASKSPPPLLPAADSVRPRKPSRAYRRKTS